MRTKITRLIEIDVDGVLLDPYPSAERYLAQQGYDVRFNQCSTYGLHELGKLREPTLKALTSPVVRKNSRLYPGADKFIKQLSVAASEFYWDVCLHTSEYNAECIPIKKKIIENIVSDMPVRAVIEVGDKHMFGNAFICIEDCADNLLRSPAPIKICRAQFHNENTSKEIFRTDKYDVMLSLIVNVMRRIERGI